MCNDTLIQSIKNSTEIHCYLHQQYFAALAQYHVFSSHRICLKIKLQHYFFCPSSLWVSFHTVHFLLFFFLFLLYSEPADNSVVCSNTCNGSTWRTQELSIQTVPLQDVYLVCRFVTCLHFLAEFSRTWSQNIRNASFSLGCQCLREMHMHCKPTNASEWKN